MNDHQKINMPPAVEPYPAAQWIKEIGRGVKGARSISRADAFALYRAVLDRRVSDLELGAILLAMRIKGESVDEIAGFLEAAETCFDKLQAPAASHMPIVIPSYNGARRAANLTPLLALLLARAGAPVLVHGVEHDPGRVTTAEIFTALGIRFAHNHSEANDIFAQALPVFIPIQYLAPRLAELLAIRRVLGVRNSTHTLVKMLQPFEQPALRLSSYTHPEYAKSLGDYFTGPADPARGPVLLMRATEGETVANVKKVQQIDLIRAGLRSTLCESEPGTDTALDIPADAQGTAAWIQRVLDDKEPVPENIRAQVAFCLQAAQ